MTAEPTGAAEVFYCYAYEDRILRDELEKHLGILRRQGRITGWHDRDISAGTDWAHEIDTHLNSASIILLLVQLGGNTPMVYLDRQSLALIGPLEGLGHGLV